MKNLIILVLIAFYLLSCSTDANDTQYEPLYLNETSVNVLFLFADNDSLSQNSDDIMIYPADTIYCLPGGYFPLLQENGLRWSEKSPFYDVKLVFFPNTDSSKCLAFEGEKFQEKDIRNFSSYENIGKCEFCVIRAMTEPEGMLYRITDDMLKEAEPCE